MRLLSKVSDWLSQTDPYARPTNLGRSSLPIVRGALDPDRVPEWFTRAPDWSAWDNAAVLADAVAKCTVLFACLTYLADAISESPLEVYKTVDGEREIADDRVAATCRDLLTSPNPFMSGSEFNLLMVLTMGVHGYSVVEKVRAGSGLPVQLWLLRPDWLVRRQRSDGTKYWEYRGSTKDRRIIPDEDVVVVPYYPDPSMERRGLSPGQVAAREIGIDSGLTDFLKTFLDAGGIPPFVLTHPDPMFDDAVIIAMQEKWRTKYGGSRAYGALPVLHGGYAIQEIGGSIDEMAWPDLRGLSEQKICQAFRVPLELVQGQLAMKSGGLETTRMEGAMSLLQRYGCAPLRARIDGALSRGVLAEFTGGDPSYELMFNVDGILALQEDEDAKHTRVRADYTAGIITLNEARRGIGEQEIPTQGDVLALPFSVTLTPLDALIDLTPSTTTTAPPLALPADSTSRQRSAISDQKLLTADGLQLRASSLDRTRRDRKKLTEIGTRALKKFWQAQGERITDIVIPPVRAGWELASPSHVAWSQTERIAQRALAEIDWDAEERELAKVLLRFYHANGEAAFSAAGDLLGVSVDWTLANPNVQRVVSGLARRIVGIAETTRIDVAGIVGDALTEGVSIPELSQRLTGLFTETYANRAVVVSRTESAAAYNKASRLSFEESGQVNEVQLHDNPAHDTDPMGPTFSTCSQRDGLIVPLSDADAYTDSMHPNCVMALSPILAKPLGEA